MKNRHVYFANYIKQLRRKVGLTQLELSDMSGLAKSTISGVENGRFIPGDESMEKLSEVLKVPLEEMMMKKLEDKSNELLQEPQKSTNDINDFRAESVNEHEALKSQLILIDRFNKLNKVNQKQLIEIAQVLVNNQK